MLDVAYLEGLFGGNWIEQKNGDLVKDLKTGKLVVRQKIRMDSNFSGYISLYINTNRKPIQVRSYSWRRFEGFEDAVNAMYQFILNMEMAALHAIPHSSTGSKCVLPRCAAGKSGAGHGFGQAGKWPGRAKGGCCAFGWRRRGCRCRSGQQAHRCRCGAMICAKRLRAPWGGVTLGER